MLKADSRVHSWNIGGRPYQERFIRSTLHTPKVLRSQPHSLFTLQLNCLGKLSISHCSFLSCVFQKWSQANAHESIVLINSGGTIKCLQTSHLLCCNRPLQTASCPQTSQAWLRYQSTMSTKLKGYILSSLCSLFKDPLMCVCWGEGIHKTPVCK